MKKISLSGYVSAAIVVLIICMSSCGGCNKQKKKSADNDSTEKAAAKKYMPKSKGAPYEIFLIMDRSQWIGQLGDTLRHALKNEIPMLNQSEPAFDMLSAPRNEFERAAKMHRNVIIVNTDPQYKTPSMTAEYDVYARPQLIVTISGDSNKAVIDYVWQNRAALESIFMIAERDRDIENNSKNIYRELAKTIDKKFGFTLDIPMGYRLRVDRPDFLWISQEMPIVSLGVIIYQKEYTGAADFSVDSLIALRNRFVNRYIPGPSDGSYMTTAPRSSVEPLVRKVRINGRMWVEMRTFWDVEHDYMGGPMTSYSTYDEATKKVVTFSTYLYSPKKPKRNFYRTLENLIYSIQFDGDAPIESKKKIA